MARRGDTTTAVAAFATAAAASCCAVWVVWRLRKERERFFQEKLHAETALTKALKLRAEERLGRTNAERRLRCFQQNQANEQRLVYQPIGYLESCFRERRGTPRQGMLAPAARSKLRILPKVVQAAALEGIEEFSHVWLLWDFHENTNSSSAARRQHKCVKAKIHPPGLLGAKVGLFATRTPHRPNPIGLSLCRLVRVEGEGDGRDTLVLGGADVVDGTPILDVKPYLRHDCVQEAAAADGVREEEGSADGLTGRCGVGGGGGGGGGGRGGDGGGGGNGVDSQLSRTKGSKLRVPSWCSSRDDASLLRRVRFQQNAIEGMRSALLHAADDKLGKSGPKMRFYCGIDDLNELQEAIRQTLLLDIRSIHQGRGQKGDGQTYHMRLDALNIEFETHESHVLVVACMLENQQVPSW